MAIPMIAAGIAARAIAKKLATRATGGITGSGAKNVAPVYRNSPVSKMLGDSTGVRRNQSGSIKVTSGVTKQEQNMVNNMRTELLNDKKSGVTAKNSAAMRERVHLGIPKKPTIKVNSNTRAR